LSLGLRGYRLWVGGSSPPRQQLLHGIHDHILVEETAVSLKPASVRRSAHRPGLE
jgi:hypothetical protein